MTARHATADNGQLDLFSERGLGKRAALPATAEDQIANRSYLERDAHHEAGHCVCAALLGVPIDSVELRPGQNPSGRFRFGKVTPAQHDAVVVIAKAGLLAELAFDPSAPREPRRQDEMIAARAMRGNVACLFPAPKVDYLADAQARALQLVTENFLTVTALADLLISKGKLSGQEVTDFVRRHTPQDTAE